MLFQFEYRAAGDPGRRWCCGSNMRVPELESMGGANAATDVLSCGAEDLQRSQCWCSSVRVVDLETCGGAGAGILG